MIFVGDDWAQEHHDVYLMDEAGRRLASRRLPEGLTGIRQLHELVAAHAEEPATTSTKTSASRIITAPTRSSATATGCSAPISSTAAGTRCSSIPGTSST